MDDRFYGVKAEALVPIDCHPGELLFLNLADFAYTGHPEDDDRKGDWQIQLHDTLPSTFTERLLIIYKDGKWLVGAP